MRFRAHSLAPFWSLFGLSTCFRSVWLSVERRRRRRKVEESQHNPALRNGRTDLWIYLSEWQRKEEEEKKTERVGSERQHTERVNTGQQDKSQSGKKLCSSADRHWKRQRRRLCLCRHWLWLSSQLVLSLPGTPVCVCTAIHCAIQKPNRHNVGDEHLPLLSLYQLTCAVYGSKRTDGAPNFVLLVLLSTTSTNCPSF